MCGQLTGLVYVQSHLAHVPKPDSLAFPFLQKHGYVFLGPYHPCEAVAVKKSTTEECPGNSLCVSQNFDFKTELYSDLNNLFFMIVSSQGFPHTFQIWWFTSVTLLVSHQTLWGTLGWSYWTRKAKTLGSWERQPSGPCRSIEKHVMYLA